MYIDFTRPCQPTLCGTSLRNSSSLAHMDEMALNVLDACA